MNNPAITKTYSNLVLSCYTDNARKYAHNVKFHSLVYIIRESYYLRRIISKAVSAKENVSLSAATTVSG